MPNGQTTTRERCIPSESYQARIIDRRLPSYCRGRELIGRDFFVFMRGSVTLMRGSCAGKFPPGSSVFIFPVVKVKTHKFRKMLPLDLRFLWFSMVLQKVFNGFTPVFHCFTMVFNGFTMVFNAFTMLLQWFSMLLQCFSMLLQCFYNGFQCFYNSFQCFYHAAIWSMGLASDLTTPVLHGEYTECKSIAWSQN